MKKPFIICITAFLLILLSPTVLAQNQFQDITDLLGDVFGFIGKIFTLDMFSEPELAFGFLLFLIGILLVTILYIGAGALFKGKQSRQAKVVAVIMATITVVMFNFRREFFFLVFGHWLVWIYFICIYGVVGLIIWANITNKVQHHGVKAFLYFMALMITIAAKQDLVPFLEKMQSAMVGCCIGFLGIYLRRKCQI
ncbi:hypothetical protein KY320_03080 [Candidatus Woesearchaeota archaeon]|nr:hypothetical protein [Candidatus Woesearchaeota archaeon]